MSETINLGWYELSLDVKDFESSCGFYETLGFQVVDRSDKDRRATVQRGNCRLGLYQGRKPEPSLLFWQGDVVAITRDLQARGLEFEQAPAPDEKGAGALLRDPDGLAIDFINIHGETRQGPPMKGDRALGWFVTTLAVADLERSVAFYQKLGFQRRARGVDPEHVATLGKDDCSIGLYQGIIEPDRLQLTFWQSDVDAVSDGFAAKGVRFIRRSRDDRGGVGSVLADPDGKVIHLINESRLARAEAS